MISCESWTYQETRQKIFECLGIEITQKNAASSADAFCMKILYDVKTVGEVTASERLMR